MSAKGSEIIIKPERYKGSALSLEAGSEYADQQCRMSAIHTP